jgi:hypothetical protein
MRVENSKVPNAQPVLDSHRNKSPDTSWTYLPFTLFGLFYEITPGRDSVADAFVDYGRNISAKSLVVRHVIHMRRNLVRDDFN